MEQQLLVDLAACNAELYVSPSHRSAEQPSLLPAAHRANAPRARDLPPHVLLLIVCSDHASRRVCEGGSTLPASSVTSCRRRTYRLQSFLHSASGVIDVSLLPLTLHLPIGHARSCRSLDVVEQRNSDWHWYCT